MSGIGISPGQGSLKRSFADRFRFLNFLRSSDLRGDQEFGRDPLRGQLSVATT